MFYTILWLIVWLLQGANGFTFNGPVFFALLVAIIADVVTWTGVLKKP